MAENVPPSAGSASADATRGLPYYEKLKRDLRETLQKKRALDKSMAMIEEQIYRQESAYLEDTSAGNIIKGFDNYIKGSNTSSTAGGGAGTSTRRKNNVIDHDRIFSRSSASFMKESSPDLASTPSHAATPTSAHTHRDSGHATPTHVGSQKGGPSLKRSKKPEKDEEEMDVKPPKRLKITYARGERGGD